MYGLKRMEAERVTWQRSVNKCYIWVRGCCSYVLLYAHAGDPDLRNLFEKCSLAFLFSALSL